MTTISNRFNSNVADLNTSYSELQRVFGKQENDGYDGGKSQTNFTIKTPFGEVEIYDWKQYSCECEGSFEDLDEITEWSLNMLPSKPENYQGIQDFIINELNN